MTRIGRLRGRRRLAVLVSTTLLAGFGVIVATTGPAAADIQSTGSFNSVCTTTLLPNVTNSFDYSIDVPASVDPGTPFTARLPGGSTNFPATNTGLAISSYSGLYTQYRFENATVVADSVTSAGAPTINGVPTTGFSQIPDPSRLKIGTNGPIPPGTLVTQDTTFQLVPTVAGVPVKVYAEQAGTTVQLTAIVNPVVATCPLQRRLVSGSTTVYEIVPVVVATIPVSGTPPSTDSTTTSSSSSTTSSSTSTTSTSSTSTSTTSTTIAPPTGPTISVQDVSVVEPEKGTTKAILVVSLSEPSTKTVTVRYATEDGTATSPADYTRRRGTVTFPPGRTSVPVNVVVKADKVPEPDEDFFFTLSSPKNATLAVDAATVTIVDNGPVGISIEDSEVDRPERGSTTMTFTVTLTKQPESGKQATVRYKTMDLGATAGSDYRAKTGVVRFPKNKLTATIKVTVLAGEYDGDENFLVQLYDPKEAVIVDGIAQGVIWGW